MDSTEMSHCPPTLPSQGVRLRGQIDCEVIRSAVGSIPSTDEVLNFIALKYFQAVDASKPEELNGYLQYLRDVRNVLVVDVQRGSLAIIMEISSQQILEELWEDYLTGHLNEVAQKFLVTEVLLTEFCLTEVRLTTSIAVEEYRACKDYFLKCSGEVTGPVLTDGSKGTRQSPKMDSTEMSHCPPTLASKAQEGEVIGPVLTDGSKGTRQSLKMDSTETSHWPPTLPSQGAGSARMNSFLAFKRLLMGIADRLSEGELVKMKFGVLLSKGKLQGIQKPFELFDLMMEAGLFSADNLSPLAELLEFAGRTDLSHELISSTETSHSQATSPSPTQRGVPETAWLHERLCYVGALPCKPAYFYGRDKQLEEIVDVLRGTNGKRLVHITGLPGYGKSCLAQRIGHVMAENGFQVIFLCLREIKCVSKMCANILIALKPNMCHSLARKQRELVLKLLSETSKTVLILDNAEDILNEPEESKEFYGFLNHLAKFAGGVKCVITSRVSCPVSCQILHHPVKLLQLTNDDAAKLLQAKLQSANITLKDDEAKTIADLCLNIPLILHAAAAYMENVCGPETLIPILQKHFTPLELENMEELSPDLRMKSFLHDCLQHLDHELEKALVSLAVFPAAFHRDQVFIVFGLQQLEAEMQVNMTLLQLMKRSLIHRDVESNHYFVHRLIQLCCEEKAQKDKTLRFSYNQARERFVNHYLSLITELHQRFLCKHALKEAICDYWQEEQHIIQAILWATESDTRMAAKCAQVLNEAVVFLAKVMEKRDFEAVYKVVLHANRGEARLQADCLTCVGIRLIYSCECHRTCSVVSEESYRVLKKAMEMYEQLGVTEGELVAQCYSKLARCMAKNGSPTIALEFSGKALEIRKKVKEKEPFKYAACCNDRAVVLSALNIHEEALSLREDALSVYVEQLDDHPFTGTLYNYLGNDCLALGYFDKAVEHFSVALRIRKSFLGDCHQETARTLHDLGVAYKMKGEYENAMTQLDEAVKVQEALCDVPHEKLKSLQQALEICVQLNASEDSIRDLQQKIQECESQVAQARQSNNVRLEQIMDIVNNDTS